MKKDTVKTFKTISEIEKNLFPKYYQEKIIEQQKKENFKNFHMKETLEIKEYLNQAFRTDS